MQISNRFIKFSSVILVLIIGLFFIEKETKPNIILTPAEIINPVVSIEATSSEYTDININKTENPLFSPSKIIKAVYATSWSMSKPSYVDYLINLASSTEINAVVIDVKDYSGYVTYDTKLPEVEKYQAKQVRNPNMGSLVKKFHEQDIYVIARISIFQDPRLALARPDLAVHSKKKINFLQGATSTASLWLDRMGLAWIDPAAKDAWKYNIDIAKEVLNQGFDELNFDYVRFPSDGSLQDMVFPFWNGSTSKHAVIKEFFGYVRQQFPNEKISVDLFGLTTIKKEDLGVGQIIEDGYEYFDYVCPMTYPSHYATGFEGYLEPAEYPYEVVKISMENALRRLKEYNQSNQKNAKLRPWLQDFSLKTQYDAQKVKAQIKAVIDVMGEDFGGFMLWSAQNIYTKEALESAE